jgi:hypothetical protein
MFRMTLPVIGLLAAAACSGRDATAPLRVVDLGLASSRSTSSVNEVSGESDSQRSGTLSIAKECSHYTGLAGSYCTLTSSNLKQLPAGTKVVYTKGLVGSKLETDVILYPPGNGASVAYGHVSLDLAKAYGLGTLSGGTGRFKHLDGRFDITPRPGVRAWAWTGRYSFAGEGSED